jgi:hypothetical protein
LAAAVSKVPAFLSDLAPLVAAVLFCVAFVGLGVVNAKCIGASVVGGAFGLLIGSLLGWLMAKYQQPDQA